MSITAVPPGKKHRKKNKKAQKALKPQWSTYKRIAWLLPVFALFFLALLIRIFWLQVIDAKELQQKALSQWTRPTTVTAERGMIIDCNGQTLAKDGPVYKIVIWPNSISESDRVRVATELSRVLDLNYEKVLERVSSKKLREFILKRQVSKEACLAAVSEFHRTQSAIIRSALCFHKPLGSQARTEPGKAGLS